MLKKGFIYLVFLAALLAGCKDDKIGFDYSPGGGKGRVNADHFYFVGKALYTPGIYKYTFKNKRAVKVWADKNQRVIQLLYSEDLKRAFFLTAKRYGRLGVFPFIERIRLYTLDPSDGGIKFITDIGTGLEVYARWETEESFSVILNSLDDNVAAYINQQKKIFSSFGKLISDETKTFDLTSDGYPVPERSRSGLSSPDGRYTFSAAEEEITEYFIEAEGRLAAEILKTNQKLRQHEWIDDERIVFTTADISPENKTLYSHEPETSKLIIYSAEEDKMLKYWEGGGVKNFLIINNILIFDNGFENKSKINLIDLGTLKQFDVIKISGGCGIKYIPELPDYGK